MDNSKRLDWLDFKIYEVIHQERLSVHRDIAYHWKNISRKYNTYIKSRI
jgi:hypothetical protein